MNFWSKRIKNNKSIADALEVDESKIKALKNGSLEIKGKTLDKTLQAIEEERINKAIRENEIWKWVQETDFKAKRLEYGYKTQREVAKLIGCDTSIICNLEKHKEQFKRITPKLIDIYNFYTNDFNKKIKGDASIKVVLKSKTKPQVDKDKKDIWKWYKKTNIRELRKNSGIASVYDMAHKLGISESCVSDLELKRFKRVNKSITNAYNYFNYKDQPQENLSKDVMREPTENNTFVIKKEEPTIQLVSNGEIDLEVEKLKYKLELLEELNKKYEKIIEKLVERL